MVPSSRLPIHLFFLSFVLLISCSSQAQDDVVNRAKSAGDDVTNETRLVETAVAAGDCYSLGLQRLSGLGVTELDNHDTLYIRDICSDLMSLHRDSLLSWGLSPSEANKAVSDLDQRLLAAGTKALSETSAASSQ